MTATLFDLAATLVGFTAPKTVPASPRATLHSSLRSSLFTKLRPLLRRAR
ncbi:MAG: hypothetical protein ACK4Q4_04795 [Rhodocyclaceae bacterium]